MDEVRPCGHVSSPSAGRCAYCDVLGELVATLMRASPLRTNREIAEVTLGAMRKLAGSEPEKLAASLGLSHRDHLRGRAAPDSKP